MRSVSGDGEAVLPWQVIREDGDGNRYRVGSYATRTEAQQVADRLGGSADRAGSGKYDREDGAKPGGETDGPVQGGVNGRGAGSYLVESLDRASGEYA
jgi:hypothetical protein